LCSITTYSSFALFFSSVLLAPNVYPVDLFERIWVVDRLERLGISRYLKTEIVSLLEYVHKYIYSLLILIYIFNSIVSFFVRVKYQLSMYLYYRSWSDQGICWARDSGVHDIDDTSMAFRLLRLHGYEVSSCEL
jgi:ent-copalyl diphosphate synthase